MFPYKFKIFCSNSVKNALGDRDFSESADCFGTFEGQQRNFNMNWALEDIRYY